MRANTRNSDVAAPVGGPRYRVRHLALPGGLNAIPWGLNDRGDVVGLVGYDDFPTTRSYVWLRDGRRIRLKGLGGEVTTALAINDRREVVGYATTLSGDVHGVRWQLPSPHAIVIPTATRASDINDHGEILGDMLPNFGPAVWSPNGDVRALPQGSAQFASANAINQHDTSVGTIARPRTLRFAGVTWPPHGSMRILPGYDTQASSLNDFGDVVGFLAPRSGGPDRPVIWRDGQLHLLPRLLPDMDLNEYPLDVNNQGDAVGFADLYGGFGPAVLWHNGHAYDLQTRIPSGSATELLGAVRINNHGDITAVNAGDGTTLLTRTAR